METEKFVASLLISIALLSTLAGNFTLLWMVIKSLTKEALPSKTPKDWQRGEAPEPVWVKKLYNLHTENPEAFMRKYKRLLGAGTRYIARLFFLIFCMLIFTLANLIAPLYIGPDYNTLANFLSFESLVMGAATVFFAYLLIKALRITFKMPEGFRLSKTEHAHIWKIIDNARMKVGAAATKEAFIVHGSMCGVAEIPEGYGWSGKNTIIIGAALLQLCSEKELEAILLHEFAHIYHKDTALNRKAQQQLSRWQYLIENSRKTKRFGGILRDYGQKYLTKLQVYRAISSKRMEYSADKTAAEIMGPKSYAQTIYKYALYSLYCEKGLHKFASLNIPPHDYYTKSCEAFIQDVPNYGPMLHKEVATLPSSKYESHPSFSERTANIGLAHWEPGFAFPSGPCTLGTSAILASFNTEWYKESSKHWQEATKEYKKHFHLAVAYSGSENTQDMLAYAEALSYIGEEEKAQNIYASILKQDPQNTLALFGVSEYALRIKGEAAVAEIMQAVEQSPELAAYIDDLLYAFFSQRLQYEKWKEVEAWLAKQYKKAATAK